MIFSFSKDWETHLLHVREVLSILQKHQLVVNQKKCHLGRTSVKYLGHIILVEGVSIDSEKIKVVLEWPILNNVKGVCGFLRLTGYYQMFIEGYGKIAKPLTELTKKDGFK